MRANIGTDHNREAVAHRSDRVSGLRRSTVIVVERGLIESQAFLSLQGVSAQLLFLFLGRRQMEKKRTGKRSIWVCTNNGQIEFTYLEAEKKYGISKKRFARAIDELIEKGFLDVAHHGGAYQGDKSRYSLQDSWKDYGTDKFVAVHRPKEKIQRGYRRPKRPLNGDADGKFQRP